MLPSDLLGHDLIHAAVNVPHGSVTNPGWNMLFSDFHVNYIQKPEMTDFYTAVHATSIGDNWILYAQALNLLVDGTYDP